MRATLTKGRLTLVVALIVVVVDQLSKLWAVRSLADSSIEIISGLLRFQLGTNTGAAFGMFRGAGTILGLVAIVAVGIIFYVASSTASSLDLAALGLILGGTIGNLIDRVVRGSGFFDGAVVDWIQLPNFPTFNLADTAITLGAVLLIVGAIRRS